MVGRWAYLGRDIEAAAAWTACFGGAEPVDVNDRFRALTLAHRRDFLDWIAELGAGESDVLRWYTSRISEQNPLVEKMYQRCCLHLTGMAIAADATEPLILVCEDPDVFRSLREALPHARTQWPFVPSPALAEWGYEQARFVAKAALHLRLAWRDRTLARRTCAQTPMMGAPLFAPRASGTGKRILIHACLDPSLLTTGYDRYFTALPGRLRALGHTVVILPWIYLDGGKREQFYAWFAAHAQQFVLPDAYYTLADHLWSLWQVWRLGVSPARESRFLGQPAHHWLRRSRWRQGNDVTLAHFFRYYRLAGHLQRAGARFDVFVDTFENMVAEKPLVLGLRRWAPEVRTVGYQHWASPAPLMLCNFMSRHDRRNPLPDRIVAYSAFTKAILVDEGFSADRVVAGPSLRYAEPPLAERVPEEELYALVVLPMEVAQAIAALRMYRRGLAHCAPEIQQRVESRIKPHPMTTEAEWARIAQAAELPPTGFVRVGGGLQQQLEEAHFAVTAASTASIEIAMAGRPLIQLSLWMELELDSLAWFGDRFPTVSDVDALAEAITRIGDAEATFFSHWHEVGGELHARCIAPLTDETARLFTF